MLGLSSSSPWDSVQDCNPQAEGLPTSVHLFKDNPPRIAPHLNNPSQVCLEPRLLGDFRFCQVVSHANTAHYIFSADRIIRLRWKLALSPFYLLRSFWPRLIPFCVLTPPWGSQCRWITSLVSPAPWGGSVPSLGSSCRSKEFINVFCISCPLAFYPLPFCYQRAFSISQHCLLETSYQVICD